MLTYLLYIFPVVCTVELGGGILAIARKYYISFHVVCMYVHLGVLMYSKYVRCMYKHVMGCICVPPS